MYNCDPLTHRLTQSIHTRTAHTSTTLLQCLPNIPRLKHISVLKSSPHPQPLQRHQRLVTRARNIKLLKLFASSLRRCALCSFEKKKGYIHTYMLSRVIEISLIRKIIHGNNERVEGYDVPKFQHEIPSNCSSKTVVLFTALHVNQSPTIRSPLIIRLDFNML